jgi:hypothetical protein
MTKREEPWIAELRSACAQSTQAAVARRLARAGDGKYPSASIINQALKGVYAGDIGRLQGVVEGVLMRSSVECPVIGDLPRQRCIEHQSRRFAATNPLRVLLHATCPDCEHNRHRLEE